MIIVLTATPDAQEAETLAQKIVEARLAACVQVLPQMTSVYFWEDEIQKDSEHLLLIKTLPEKFEQLKSFIQINHSYEVPEIIALATENVSESYLNWMKNYLQTEIQNPKSII